MIFKKSEKKVSVSEVKLQKEYAFMYENFVVSSQQTLYVLLEENHDKIDTLKFDLILYKYGYPNDEVSHPLSKYGLGFYGFFRVDNSPWLTEIKNNNKAHHRHSDKIFEYYKHYIVKFKDVTVEILATKFEEVEITKQDLINFVTEQINALKK
jgi:hypothetical protein